MNYLTIPEKKRHELSERCNLHILQGKSVGLRKIKEDTTYFSYTQLGFTPYTWQMLVFDMFDKGEKRFICATPRQVGKSTMISILALKCAMYNTHPDKVYNKTTVGIISSTEDQSKKLIDDIRNLMLRGDDRVHQLTGGKIGKFFTNSVAVEKTNNSTTITFINNCRIICLPPTKKARGYPFSLVFLDEAAFFEDESIYYEIIQPTVSKTKGSIFITSTPNGQKGFFFELFDPMDIHDTHEYKRLWLHYTMIDDEEDVKELDTRKKMMQQIGRVKEFEQEYEAKFTVDTSAFFDSDKIDEGVDNNLVEKHVHMESPCSIGIDFGMTSCHSVITVTTMENSIIKLLYQYTFPLDSDDNLIYPLVADLMSRFNTHHIICDDCAQGRSIIQRMEKAGLPITRFNFRSEKVERYFNFRAKLYLGKIKYYIIPELLSEMKSLQEIKHMVNLSITKPTGGFDDRIDSFVISAYPYLNEDVEFEFTTLQSFDEIMEDSHVIKTTDRGDIEWKKLETVGLELIKEQMEERRKVKKRWV